MAEERKKNKSSKKRNARTKKTEKQQQKNEKYISVSQAKYLTHTGEVLTPKQNKFIDLYIETGNQRQSFIKAGYSADEKTLDANANRLVRNKKIADEIRWRMQQSTEKSIATANEILQYLSSVMRGQEKDQFGLDAPLSERTKAAGELAKRLIDIPNKLEAISNGKAAAQATVTISLDWSGMEDDTKDDTDQEDGNQEEKC